MAVPDQMTGKNARLTIQGVIVGHTNFSSKLKRNIISQDRVGYSSPLKKAGNVDFEFSFTNLNLYGKHLAMLLSDVSGSGTRTVLDNCDASGNWVASDTTIVLSDEVAIKNEGTGSVKAVCTAASGDTIIKTLSPAVDFSSAHLIEFWFYSSVVGAVATFGFGESAITENTHTFTIQEANTWQREIYSISAISGSSRNAVTKIGFTVTSTGTNATMYFDNVNLLTGFKFSDATLFDLTASARDPTSPDTKFIDIYCPDCFFTDGDINWSGGAKAFIEGPVSGSIMDADEIVVTYS